MQCSGTLKQLVNVKIIHQYKTRALLHCLQEIATFSPRGIQEEKRMQQEMFLNKKLVTCKEPYALYFINFPVFLFLIIILFNDAAPSGKQDLNRILFLKQIKLINPWNEEKIFNF